VSLGSLFPAPDLRPLLDKTQEENIKQERGPLFTRDSFILSERKLTQNYEPIKECTELHK
jgi:hypothetical protein